MRNKLFGAISGAVALATAAASSIHAADYTSQIGTATTSILSDLATNVPAAIVLGLGLFGVMTGITVLFKALKKARAAA